MTKAWFRYYLLLMGAAITTIGVILFFRSVTSHHSLPGLILGVSFIIYGFLRLHQRKLLSMHTPK